MTTFKFNPATQMKHTFTPRYIAGATPFDITITSSEEQQSAPLSVEFRKGGEVTAPMLNPQRTYENRRFTSLFPITHHYRDFSALWRTADIALKYIATQKPSSVVLRPDAKRGMKRTFDAEGIRIMDVRVVSNEADSVTLERINRDYTAAYINAAMTVAMLSAILHSWPHYSQSQTSFTIDMRPRDYALVQGLMVNLGAWIQENNYCLRAAQGSLPTFSQSGELRSSSMKKLIPSFILKGRNYLSDLSGEQLDDNELFAAAAHRNPAVRRAALLHPSNSEQNLQKTLHYFGKSLLLDERKPMLDALAELSLRENLSAETVADILVVAQPRGSSRHLILQRHDIIFPDGLVDGAYFHARQISDRHEGVGFDIFMAGRTFGFAREVAEVLDQKDPALATHLREYLDEKQAEAV